MDDFSIEVLATSSGCDLNLMVRPGTDYDSRFEAVCVDTGERLVVHDRGAGR